MGLITSHQVWKQKRGKVRIRILWFCKAGHCTKTDERSQQYRLMNHVHITGWHEITMRSTNHTIMRASDLTRDWDLVL